MKVALSPSTIGVAPGGQVDVVLTITNDGDDVLAPVVSLTGIAAEHVAFPDGLDEVPPGAATELRVQVTLPGGTPPGHRRIGFTASDPAGVHATVGAALAVEVGAPPPVTVELVPPVVRGRRVAKLSTVIHGIGDAPATLSLTGSGDAAEVSFLETDPVIAPGEERHVPTRIVQDRRAWFRERRHGAVVEARSGGGPVAASAAVIQTPLFPPPLLKAIAFVTLLAVWATLVFVGYERLTRDDVDPSKWIAMSERTAEALARGADGEDPASGDADDIDPDDVLLAAGVPVVVQGTVSGPADPAGTDVVIERIAFGDEGTTSGEGGRLAAMAPVSAPLGAVIGRMDTTTDERGAFRFAGGLDVPAFYRVTATRPGFEVASQVVTTSEEERDLTVDLELDPAPGRMSGRVTDTSGRPLGGADVTVTDGTLTFTATSATEGEVGSWSLSGIAAPASYEVSVSRHGYATATLHRSLEGGQELSGVDAELAPGLGTIRGRVTHRGEGVGGVTVHLTGNPTDRTTTTLTDGGVTGSFEFPALSFGTYDLTFSGDGWLTQTAEVVVDRGDVEVSVTDLRPATGTIQGRVHQQVVAGSGCQYPDPDVPEQREQLEFRACGGVGITVTGDDVVWRTTSATGDGSFQVSGLPPGQYLVAFEQLGYEPEYLEVTLDAGDVVTLPRAGDARHGQVVQLGLEPPLDTARSTIVGRLTPSVPTRVGESFPPARTNVTVLDQPGAAVDLTGDVFTLEGMTPGAHRIAIEAPGYAPRTVVAVVPLAGTAELGDVVLTPLGSLVLQVAGAQMPIGDAEVFVAPDPIRYPDGGDGLLTLEPDLHADVDECTREIVLDGQPRTLDGICLLTDVVGDVEFRQIFGTGAFVLATPTNVDDLADDPARRATTVPLDHDQHVRRVDLQPGSTSRFDLNLRRYPIITGTVLRPADDGGLEVARLLERGDVTLERIDDSGTVLPLPADAPQPRISAGADDEFNPPSAGQFRIDRIPSDTPTEQYRWRLIISHGGDTFDLGLIDPLEAIVLSPNEIRSITALMLPAPRPIALGVSWEPAGGTGPEPVPGALLQLYGTSDFDVTDTSAYFPRRVDCPGPECFRLPHQGDDPFNFTPGARPLPDGSIFPRDARVVSSGGELWLQTTVDTAAGASVFDMPTFFRPGNLTGEIRADGFATRDIDTEFTSAEEGDGAVELTETMVVLPRTVTGTVQLLPPAAFPPGLADLVATDADILTDLEVELAGGDLATPLTSGLTSGGGFSFGDITPGYYELSVSGPRVEDHGPTEVVVTPGSGSFVVTGDAVQVTRRGIARLELESVFDGAGLAGVDIALERRLQSQGDGAFTTYRTLTTCAGTGGGGGGPSCAQGRVTFDELPLTSASGEPWVYRYVFSEQGYDVAAGDEIAPFTPQTAPYVDHDVRMNRFAELSGTVIGEVLDEDGYPLDTQPLDGATVTLVNRFAGTPIGGATPTYQVTTGADGSYSFPYTMEIPPREEAGGGRYGLLFEYAGYQSLLVPEDEDLGFGSNGFTFSFNSVISAVDPTLEALPGSLYGHVTGPDGYVLHDDPAVVDDVPVDVELYRLAPDGSGDPDTLVASTSTIDPAAFPAGLPFELDPAAPDGAGAYLFTEIPAGRYRLVLTADDVDLQTVEVDVDPALTPDEHRRVDVDIAFEPGAIEGEVLVRDFAGDGETEPVCVPTPSGAPCNPTEGVQVRAYLVVDDGPDELFCSDPGDPSTCLVETDASGWFTFSEVPPGTYRLEYQLTGYGVEERQAVDVDPRFATFVPLEVLTALPVEVEVDLTSTMDGEPVLEDATVELTYTGPLTPGPDGSPFPAAFDDDDGVYRATVAPGDYEVTVSGIDDLGASPRPHVVPDVTALEVPPSDDPVTVPITADPYYRAYGTVVDENGDPAEGAAVSSSMTGSLLDPSTTGAGGEWSVWLPTRPAASSPTELTFSLDGYETLDHQVPRNAFGVGANVNLDVDRGDLELTPAPRSLVVELRSAAGASSLTGLELEATVGVTTVQATVEVSGGEVTATFDDLPPGTVTISSTNGAGRSVPHLDIEDVAVTLPPGVDPYEPDDPVVEFAAFSGTVTAEGNDLAGATVTATQGSGSVATTTSGTGDWALGVPPDTDTTISWSAAGYVAPPSESFDDGDAPGPGGFVTGVDVDLSPAVRDVEVTLDSAAGVSSLVGLELEATDGTDTETTTVASDGTATFEDLAPGTWTVSSTNAASRTIAHPDLSGIDVSVPIGDGTYEHGLLLDYAAIEGVVEGEVAPGDTEPLEDATVTLDQAGQTLDTDTDSDGEWILGALPGEATSLGFDADGYEPVPPTLVSALDGDFGSDTLASGTLYDHTQVLDPVEPEPDGGGMEGMSTGMSGSSFGGDDAVAGMRSVADTGVIVGTVAEERGGSRIAIPGVTVIAESDGGEHTTVSTDLGEDGRNYRMELPAGTYRIVVERGGEPVEVEDAFVVTVDGSEHHLDVLVPATTIDLNGRVLDDAGLPIVGASIRATSTVATVTATTGEDGGYVLGGLDDRVTWTVRFSPPDGFDGRPVTRYVALSGKLDVALHLDQVLPSGYGTIELHVSGGEPSSSVEVVLSEATPFPTLGPDGRRVVSAPLDAAGEAVVTFDELVPGDGRSVPQDRFTLTITPPGHGALTRSGLDVVPGGTTVVDVDLGLAVVPTRDVLLTVESDGGPVTDRSLRLERDGTVHQATVTPGTNVYRIVGVEPGTWTVLIGGYDPTDVAVPDGKGEHAVSVHLTGGPEDDADAELWEPDPIDEDDWDEEGTSGAEPEGDTATEGDTAPEGDTASDDDTAPESGTATEGDTAPEGDTVSHDDQAEGTGA